MGYVDARRTPRPARDLNLDGARQAAAGDSRAAAVRAAPLQALTAFTHRAREWRPMTTRYTKDHEYIRVEGDTGVVGITDYAQ